MKRSLDQKSSKHISTVVANPIVPACKRDSLKKDRLMKFNWLDRLITSLRGPGLMQDAQRLYGKKQTTRRQQRQALLSLEPLEDRCLLSTLTVTSLADNMTVDSQVTLREAIQAANTDTTVDGVTGSGADTIVFASSLTSGGPATIRLNGTQLQISSNLAIKGPGAGALTINGDSDNNGAGDSRIFDIEDGNGIAEKIVSISGLTLTKGNGTNYGYGGAIFNYEQLSIESCIISSSIAVSGGGLFDANANGTTTIFNTTFSNNVAVGGTGGGIASDNFTSGVFKLTNCLIAGNTSTYGGGIQIYGGTSQFVNCTITGNSASQYGGILVQGPLTLVNTIIAENTASSNVPDVGGLVTSSGFNLIGDTAGSTGWIASDLKNVNPLFVDSANANYRLKVGSPAIDAGTNSGAPGTDRDGHLRPMDGDSNGSLITDMGAYEADQVDLGVISVTSVGAGGWARGVSNIQLHANSFTGTWTLSLTVDGVPTPFNGGSQISGVGSGQDILRTFNSAIYADGTHTLIARFTSPTGQYDVSTPLTFLIDNTPPTITLPPTELNPVLEATGHAGTPYALHPTAFDNLDSTPTLTLTPALTTYPLGSTNVAIQATDAAGNTRTINTLIRVQDTIAPTLTLPPNEQNRVVDATAPDGVVLQWDPVATDIADSNPIITSNLPDSGVLPIGTTLVTFTATDSSGNHSSVSTTVTVYDNRPFASFTVAPSPAAPSQSLLFDASGSTQGRPDRTLVSYAWDFGDGSTASGVNVTHTYSSFGNFTATLIVTDDNVPPKTSTTTLPVVVNLGNRAPVANAGGPYQVAPGSPLFLDGSGSTDPDSLFGDRIVSYSWDLNNDGSFDFAGANAITAVSSAQVQSLLGPGVHPVRLQVVDSLGLSSTAITQIAVGASVNLSVSANSGSEAGKTTITVSATANSPVVGDQTVDVSVSGLGITSSDYTLSSTRITILNGMTTGSATFTVTDDLLNEGDETATLTISNPSAGMVLGSTTTQNITITDDDNAGTSNFSLPSAGAYRLVLNSGMIQARDSGDNVIASRAVGIDPIVINGTAGNDTLTIDFSGGNFAAPITFNGGSQASTPGDSLILTGGSFTTGTFAFTDDHSGTVDLAGNSRITYTGLEPIVTTGLTINDLIFTFNGGSESIALGDAAGPNMTIESTLGESVTFANPSSSLTINAGTGNDTVAVNGVDTNGPFIADLTINGNGGNDTVTLNSDITFAPGKNLDVNLTDDATAGDVDSILIGANANLILAGSGAAILRASKNIDLASGSSIVTVDGNLDMQANQQATPAAGTFVGINVNGGLIQATGTGVVTVAGQGGTDSSGSQFGIYVSGGGDIIGGTSGLLTVQGTGGLSSGGRNYGVYVIGVGSTISSNGSNVAVTGTGSGTGSSDQSFGVLLMNAGAISAGGSGTVNVVGNAGLGAGAANYGVYLLQSNSRISSSDGNVSVTGTGGGSGSSQSNIGVVVDQSQIIAGGSGTVTVVGNGGNISGTGNTNYGVLAVHGNTQITSGGGNVSVTGTEGGGTGSTAIVLSSSAAITTATNGGSVTLVGNSMSFDATATMSAPASSSVTLRQLTNGVAINLGTATDPVGGPLNLTAAELDRITAGTLVIGSGASGPITVSGNITRSSSTNMQLVSGGDIVISGGQINTGGGSLLLDAGTSPNAVKPTRGGVDVTASTLSFDGDLAIAINGPLVDTDYSQLNIAGVINLAGVNLVLSGSYSPSATDSFTIVNNDGGDAIVGTFNGLVEGAIVIVHGTNKRISYVGGTGNDVVLLDALPPTVTGTNPSFATSGTLDSGTTSLQVGFSENVTGGATASNFELRSQGADGLLGTADDPVIALSASYSANTTTLSFAGLSEGVYRLTVKDAIADVAANVLDGDANGSAGGDWRRDFVVGALNTTLTSPNGFTFDPEFGGFGAGQLVQGTGNAFDGVGRLQVGGTDYAPTILQIPAAEVTEAQSTSHGISSGWNTFTTNQILVQSNPNLLVNPNGTMTYNGSGPSALLVDASFEMLGSAGSTGYIQFLKNGSTHKVFQTQMGGGFKAFHVDDYISVVPGDTISVRAYNPGSYAYEASQSFLRVIEYPALPITGPTAEVTEVKSTSHGISSGWNTFTTNQIVVQSNPNLSVNPNGTMTYNGTGPSALLVDASFLMLGSTVSTGYIQFLKNGSTHKVLQTQMGGGFETFHVNDYIPVVPGDTISVLAYNPGSYAYEASQSVLRVIEYPALPITGPTAEVTEVKSTSHGISSGWNTFTTNQIVVQSNPNLSVNPNGTMTYNGTGPSALLVDASFLMLGSTVSTGYIQFLKNGSTHKVLQTQMGDGFKTFHVDDYITVVPGDTISVRAYNPGSYAYEASQSVLRVIEYPTLAIPVLADNQRSVVTSAESIAGLNVSREVTVPNTGTQDFARTVDTFTNPTGSPITTTVKIVGNLGSDAVTTVFATSDGDTIVESTDTWFGTDDLDGTGTPAIIHLLHGPGGLVPTEVQVIGDNVDWTYNITVGPGETQRLASFIVLGTTRAEAIAAANVLVTSTGFGGQAAAFLSAEELGSLANFQYGTLNAGLDGSGNLTINDVSGKNNSLTATRYNDGVNDFLDITDATERFVGLPVTTPASSLTNGGRTLRVPMSAITGSITVNGNGGNDTLTVDLSVGDFIPVGGIAFNGGESSGDADSLKIIGYSLMTADGIADVTVTHTGADAGNVVLAGLGTVSFMQTEPLTLGGDAADLVLTLPSGADSVTLGDDGVMQDVNGNTPNTSALYDATGPAYSFEFTEFTNPTNSLKINRGSAADDLTVLDLVNSAMTASLTLGENGSEFDQIAFNGPITLASNKNLAAFAMGTISLPNTTSDLAMTGTGAISLTTARNVTVSSGASITTVNGNLTVNANQQFTPTTGSFSGIDINGGLIQATGAGAVTIQGQGGNGGGGSQFGIRVSGGGDIIGGLSGLLTVQGTGGLSSGGRNYGVYEDGAGSTITSSGGNVAVIGNGSGSGSSDQSFGVLMTHGAEISAAGSGTVNVAGNAGAGAGNSNYGVYMLGGNAHITSGGGNVSVTGTGGGSAASSYNAGVVIDQSEISAGSNGTVTVTGHGGNTLGTGTNNYGVLVVNSSSGITSDGGDVSVSGTEGGGTGSVAILLTSSGAITTATNGGNITLAGNSMNFDPSSTISTQNGNGVTLRQFTNGVAINLGTGADPIGGPLGLSDAELDRITAGTVQIGNGNSGTITVSAAITHANNLLLTTPAGIVIDQAVTMSADKNLTVTATGVTAGISLTTSDSDLSASGTGSISVISTRDISLASGSSVTTVDGGLNVQANQQIMPTAGSFTGIDINGGLIQASGTGAVTVQGKGGNSGVGSQFGIHVSGGGDIIGGTSGLLTVQGTGGLSSGGRNYGIYEEGAGSTITSGGGNVAVMGIGSGAGGSDQSFGILLMNAAEISAGGNGTVNVIGNAGAGAGGSNYGVYTLGGNAHITSGGGNVSVTGTGGGSAASSYNAGVVIDQSEITAGDNGTVTVAGTGGNTTGTGINNYGVLVVNTSSGITSGGGNVAVTGTEGGGTGSLAILLTSSGAITTATNGGNITLAGNSMNFDPSSTISTPASGSVFLRQLTNGVAINLGATADPIGGPLGLTDAELDRVFAGTINIGDTNSGRITISDAITLNTNLALTSGPNGIAAESSGTLFTSGATVTLNTTGPIGTAAKRIQFADNPNTVQQNVIVGSTNQATSVFLDGLGSLTLGNITGNTANTTVDVTARENLTVASGATLTTGTGAQILGANLTAAGASSGGTGTLTISNSATVTSTSSAASAITLLGADQVLNGQIVATGHTVTLLQSGTEGFDLGAISEVLANTVELSDAELNTISATKLVIGNANAGSITISRALDLTDTPAIDTLHLISGNQVLESGAEGIKVANLAVEAIQDITLDSANNDVAKLALQTTGTSANASYVDANGFIVANVDDVDGINVVEMTTLKSGSNVTQSAPVVSTSLLLTGQGNYDLNGAGNDVDTLAASVTNRVYFSDIDDLTIGTVGPTNGTSSSELNAHAATIVVFEPIIATMSGGVILDVTTLLNIDGDTTGLPAGGTPIINSAGPVQQTGAGGVELQGKIVATNANVSFASAVRMTGPTVIDTGSGIGNITFSNTLNGTTEGVENLTLTAGTGSVLFAGQTGSPTRVGVVTINSAANVTTNVGFSAASFKQTAGSGTTTINGFLSTNTLAGIDLTSNYITLNGVVTTTATGPVKINNGSDFQVVAGAGAINSDGPVTQTGAGLSLIGGSIVTTDDSISFASDTYISGTPVTMNAGNGNVSFAKLLQVNNKTLTLRDGNAVELGTQTTIANGTLNVYLGGSGTAPNSLNIGSGDVLTGTGTVNATLNVGSGATLAPASATTLVGTGILTFNGDVNLAAGSAYNVDLNSTTAGTGYDQIIINGAGNEMNITAGAVLQATRNAAFSPTVGTALKILDGVNTVNGTFTGMANGSTLFLNGAYFTVSYNSPTGDLVLTNAAAPGGSSQILDNDGGSILPTGSTSALVFAGTWTSNTVAGRGFTNDLRFASPTTRATPTATATYTFTGLTAGGTYRVSATWFPQSNRARNAPFTISDGVTTNTILVNQVNAPSTFAANGAAWQDLAPSFTLGATQTTLTVTLGNQQANGYVIADAVRIEAAASAGPEVQVLAGGTDLANNAGTVDFGTIMQSGDHSTDLTRTVTIKNVGSSPLILGTAALTMPAGYHVSGYTPGVLAPGAAQTLQITLLSAKAGNFAGAISFQTNDSDENPFTFQLTGSVVSEVWVVDNKPNTGSDLVIGEGVIGSYSEAGTAWNNNTDSGVGFLQDLRFANAGAASTATWSFGGLTTGTYRVSVTYRAESNRASNVLFTVSDGTGSSTVQINQRNSPNDFLSSGVYWEDLVTFYAISGSALTVTLNAAGTNGYVIADAVRIEHIDAMEAAAGQAAIPVDPVLSNRELRRVANEAIDRWKATGLTDAQLNLLNHVEFHVQDLPGAELGAKSINGVYIDTNAAGHGWFIDKTPRSNREFRTTGSPTELLAPFGHRASGKMDLLTVVMHELGHIMGMGASDDPTSIMSETLSVGTRRITTSARAGAHRAK